MKEKFSDFLKLIFGIEGKEILPKEDQIYGASIVGFILFLFIAYHLFMFFV